MIDYTPKDGDIFQLGNKTYLSFKKLILVKVANGWKFGEGGYPCARGGDGQCGAYPSFEALIRAHDSWEVIRCFCHLTGKEYNFKGQAPVLRKRVLRD